MKLHVLLLFVFLLGLTTKAQEVVSSSEKSFSKIVIKEGSRNVTLTNDYKKKWKMRVNFPKASETQNTLIVALHWAGSGDTFKEFNDCLVVPGLEFLNAIIVSPESENQLWTTANNEEKIRSIIANAKKYWNVDPNKIAVVGYSNGGNGSWYFAEKYPELFTAAIPIASAYPARKKIDIPLYVIHGKKDELFKISRTEKWVHDAKEKGTEITFVVEEQLSHFQGCAYTASLKKAGKWLQNIWKKQ